MNNNTDSVWFILIGAAMGIAMVAAVCAYKRRKGKVSTYDERQAITRGKAFRSAYAALLAYTLVCGFLGNFSGIVYSAPMVTAIIGLEMSVTVFAVNCVRGDAYLTVSEKPRTYIILTGAIFIVSSILFVLNLLEENLLLKDGVLSTSAIVLGTALMSLTLCATLWAHTSRQARAAEETEDAE